MISVDKFLSTARIADPHLTCLFWVFFTGGFVKMDTCACVVPVEFAVFTRDVPVTLWDTWMLCKSGGIENISVLSDRGGKLSWGS